MKYRRRDGALSVMGKCIDINGSEKTHQETISRRKVCEGKDRSRIAAVVV